MKKISKEVRKCLEKLNATTDPVIMEISFIDTFLLITQLQLALNHPENTGGCAETVKELTMSLQEGLASRVPEVTAVLESGWRKEFIQEVPILYQDLPMLNKREIVVNAYALGQACGALSQLSGRSFEDWFESLQSLSVDYVEGLPDKEINLIMRQRDKKIAEKCTT